ncbi:MAG: sel1 repeat family protein [Flavobacterium sp.]|nr:sel1 repeat family protein [Flavobacterium sp.]
MIMLISSLLIHSQTNDNDAIEQLKLAKLQITEGSNEYNPTVGIATFNALANQGNAKAMNALGMIYCEGISVQVNEQVAIQWYEMAAINGYPIAYYNIALLYKNGVGVSKDLTKAVSYFKKAAIDGYSKAYFNWGEMVKNGSGVEKNYELAMTIFKQGEANKDSNCIYAQGYLHYKGFGTPQDYNKAVTLFELAAKKGNAIGMYMLGYCYRNGYGVIIDKRKAVYCFNKAASLGYERAIQELTEPIAENNTPNQSKTVSVSTPKDLENITNVEVPKKIINVKHKIDTNSISGTYIGKLMRYDWSGQNILNTTQIKVIFKQNGNDITGVWVEKEGDSIVFNATKEEKAIVFNDSRLDRINRYTALELTTFKFNKAKLQIIENQGDIFIVGNIQFYNLKQHEKEKPMYLILENEANQNSLIQKKRFQMFLFS